MKNLFFFGLFSVLVGVTACNKNNSGGTEESAGSNSQQQEDTSSGSGTNRNTNQ